MMYTVSYHHPLYLFEKGFRGLTNVSQILDFCYLGFVYFFYPETKNLTLEEVARVFDGDDVKVARVDSSKEVTEPRLEKDYEHVHVQVEAKGQ